MLSVRPPIIVLGANHSGTRLLVDILTALGSYPGDVENVWREEASFLRLHKEMIHQVTGAGWDEAIFDPDFVEEFRDDGRFVPMMTDHVMRYIEERRPATKDGAWHWKCPTSLLFLPSWLEVFPDATYVHVERDPIEVASSFLRRREVRGLADGERLYQAMNERALEAAPSIRRYVRVQYEGLGDQLADLGAATGLDPSAGQLEAAAQTIRTGPAPLWRSNRSLKGNIYEYLTSLRTRLYRLRHPGGSKEQSD